MTLAQVVGFALETSLSLIVFAIGLESSPREFSYLLKYPGLFARAIFSMNIVMPAFAIAAGLLFDIHPAVKIALVAFAVSPVPPHLAEKRKNIDGSADCMLGLIMAVATTAIFIIPLTMELLGWIFGAELHMPVSKVVSIVFISLFAPLGAGMILSHFFPGLAARIAHPASQIGTILLYVSLVPILIFSASTIVALVGNGVIIFPILFVVVGLAVGHVLGGPDPGNRTALALATARRHPGMAVAIASINFPDQKAVPAVIICCLLFGILLSAVYAKWRLRSEAASPPLPKYS